jgi:hypothetical protein
MWLYFWSLAMTLANTSVMLCNRFPIFSHDRFMVFVCATRVAELFCVWMVLFVGRLYVHSRGRECVRVTVTVFVQFVPSVGCWFVRLFIRSCVRSFVWSHVERVRSGVRSFARSFLRSVGRSFVYTFIRAVVLAFVCLLM